MNSPSLITANSPGMTRLAPALISSKTEVDRTMKPPMITASPASAQNKDSLRIVRNTRLLGAGAGPL